MFCTDLLVEVIPSSLNVKFNWCIRTLLLKPVSCEKEQSKENIYVKEKVITFYFFYGTVPPNFTPVCSIVC